MSENSSSRSLGPAHGLRWLKRSASALQREPLQMIGVSIFYVTVMTALSVMPYVGSVFAALFMPFGTVWFAWCTRDALAGKKPAFAVFRAIWASQSLRVTLFRIGLVFGFVLITVNALYGFLSADEVARWQVKDDRLVWDSVRQNIPFDALIAMALVYIPGLMCTWFSPLLAAQKRMPLGKSLFYSFFGCLRNLLPILTLGILLTLFAGVASLALSALVVALNLESLQLYLFTPMAFLLTAIAYGTYWPMYCALFEETADAAP